MARNETNLEAFGKNLLGVLERELNREKLETL